MRHDTQTSAQIVIIIIGTILAVIVVYLSVLFFHPVPSSSPSLSPPPPLSSVSISELHASWKTHVQSIIEPILHTTSPSVKQVVAAKDKMLSLTVASQDRDTHLAIVMALLSMERGKSGAVDRLRSAYTDSQSL